MKAAFYTLGCKVNIYETEYVINQFQKKGYKIVNFNKKADIYIINTCCVTNISESKSRKVIRQAIRRNPQAIIVVMGCYSQLKSNEIEQINGVDIIIGTKDKSKILDYVEQKNKLTKIYNLSNVPFEDMEIDQFITKTRAFVKIQDGCDSYCAYCIIPFTRGPIRSKRKEIVLKEVKKLVNNGYLEIVLTGIHTGKYGLDFTNYRLSNLLKDLTKIKELKRIRISSIEVTEIDDELLAILKNEKVIADHLHIPLQSGSDNLLKTMNRPYNTQYFFDKIDKIRTIRSDIAITTDVIVGFPGETNQDFLDTIKFIKKVNFSGLHVFPYSKKDGTKAALMLNQIDSETKKKRVKQLIEVGKELELNYMNKFINKTVDVIIETSKDNYLIGHSSNYLQVKVIGPKNEINQLIKIKINKIEYPYCIGTKH
jgi:threonylcarbamoyladenosine tRNA methylthiotransferase MtaB